MHEIDGYNSNVDTLLENTGIMKVFHPKRDATYTMSTKPSSDLFSNKAYSGIRSLFFVLFIFFAIPSSLFAQNNLQLGIYRIPAESHFRYVPDRSFGQYYVFENTLDNTHIHVSKAAETYQSKKDFNLEIYDEQLLFYNNGLFFQKKRNFSYYFNFIGERKAHFMRFGPIKSAKSKTRVYSLITRKNQDLYRVYIQAETGRKKPPKSALSFLRQFSLDKSL
jgi:hypothetical protein